MTYESKINKYVGVRFYTVDGLDVTARIKDGTTKVFEEQDLEAATAYAKEKRSYTYPIRSKEAKTKVKCFGYAVPN